MKRTIFGVLVALFCVGSAWAQFSGSAYDETKNYMKRVNTNVLPAADNTYDLGSSAKSWKNIYVNGSVKATSFIGSTGATSDGYSLDASDGSPADALYVNSIGMVGIGTSTPKGMLNTAGTSGIYVRRTENDTVARNILTGEAGDGTGSYEVSIQVQGDGSNNAVAMPFNFSGYGEVMRLTNTGNVGISSTSPTARLNVVGADSTTGKAIEVMGSTYVPNFLILNNGSVGIGTSAVGGNNERLRVFTTGICGVMSNVTSTSTNVTAAPGEVLKAKNLSATEGNYAQFQFSDANGNHQGSIGMKYGAHSGNGQGTFYIEPKIVATPSSFVVTSTGNVGMGILSPTSTLQVAGDVKVGILNAPTANQALRVYDGAIQTKLQSQTSGGISGFVGTETNNTFGILTNNVTRAMFDTTGNVGIGSTSPTARLNVVGSGSTTNPLLSLKDSTYTPRVTVLDNGNVGIGTTAPTAGLAIGAGAPTGTTGATSVYVQTNLEVDGAIYGGTGFSAGKATCWHAQGRIGYCSDTPAADGSCTCN